MHTRKTRAWRSKPPCPDATADGPRKRAVFVMGCCRLPAPGSLLPVHARLGGEPRSDSAGWAGVGGFAGHAVNPSMEAHVAPSMALMVPPTHPPPPLDSGSVAYEKTNADAARRRRALARPAVVALLFGQPHGHQHRHWCWCRAIRFEKRAAQRQPSGFLLWTLAFPLPTSPLSKGGHGWVGGTVCCHGWQHTSLHGRTCSGSRQPTRARPNQRSPNPAAVSCWLLAVGC